MLISKSVEGQTWGRHRTEMRRHLQIERWQLTFTGVDRNVTRHLNERHLIQLTFGVHSEILLSPMPILLTLGVHQA